VASLKGVILSLKPAAQLVDLSHEVASHHTLAGIAVAGLLPHEGPAASRIEVPEGRNHCG
jgi:hypothetical protein